MCPPHLLTLEKPVSSVGTECRSVVVVFNAAFHPYSGVIRVIAKEGLLPSFRH
jgi:hypothetical protein